MLGEDSKRAVDEVSTLIRSNRPLSPPRASLRPSLRVVAPWVSRRRIDIGGKEGGRPDEDHGGSVHQDAAPHVAFQLMLHYHRLQDRTYRGWASVGE